MSRYIDADALKQKWLFRGRDGKPYRDEIDAMPTADVAEVVRCKDCENWQIEWLTSCKEDNYHYCADIDDTCEAEFFCAYGKRRTNEI